MIFLREGTHAYDLFLLLANVGEFPMQSVKLLGNDRTWKRRIKELQKYQDFSLPGKCGFARFQMVSVSGKGKTKTLRLHQSSLPVLYMVNHDAYSYYMEAFEGHHFSGGKRHIDRNHRVAETVAMCQTADINVFPWEIQDIHDQNVRYMEVAHPVFYSSRQLKEFYQGEMKKTEFTRIIGSAVYPGGVYAIYNTRDQPMSWYGKGEEKTQILLSSIFFTGGCRREIDSALLFGKDFRTASATLQEALSHRHLHVKLDTIYPHLHFIPMNESGRKLLEILTTKDWKWNLKKGLYGDAQTALWPRDLDHDAFIDKTYYFFHLDGDLCRLIHFRRALARWKDESFVLDCFSEQIPYLKEFLNDLWNRPNLKIRQFELDQIHAILCNNTEAEYSCRS